MLMGIKLLLISNFNLKMLQNVFSCINLTWVSSIQLVCNSEDTSIGWKIFAELILEESTLPDLSMIIWFLLIYLENWTPVLYLCVPNYIFLPVWVYVGRWVKEMQSSVNWHPCSSDDKGNRSLLLSACVQITTVG